MKIDIYNTKNKYNIIYADPPWQYSCWSKKTENGRTAESYYNTMKFKDICNLPIKNISEDNSVLCLWVTYPFLDKGIELIKKWNFEYKTCLFTWVKMNKIKQTPFVGMGYYTRANAEICLLGVKKNKLKVQSRKVQQVILSKIEEHSKKPNEARVRIEELFGDVKRIELFARQEKDGWDCWGNEV